MDFIKDLWASLVAGARDRTTNPLSVSFVISWCLWNYRFFLVLFGDVSTWEKLDAISAMYPHQASTYCGAALLYPLLSALAYIFVYPLVSMVPIRVYRTYQIWTVNLVKRVEKARVLSQEEATELTRRHEKEIAYLEEKVTSLSNQVTELRKALSAAEEQAMKVPPSATADSSAVPPSKPQATTDLESDRDMRDTTDLLANEGAQLTPHEKTVLLVLSDSASLLSPFDIHMSTKLNLTLVGAELDSLEKKNLVVKRNSAQGEVWRLSDTGKRLVVDLLRSPSKPRKSSY